MYDELTMLLGGAVDDTPTFTPPSQRLSQGPGLTTVLMAGLQGAGKTTACAKLARYLMDDEPSWSAIGAMSEEELSETLSTRLPKSGRRVLLAACDVHRPAAREQLKVLCGRIGADLYEEKVSEGLPPRYASDESHEVTPVLQTADPNPYPLRPKTHQPTGERGRVRRLHRHRRPVPRPCGRLRLPDR